MRVGYGRVAKDVADLAGPRGHEAVEGERRQTGIGRGPRRPRPHGRRGRYVPAAAIGPRSFRHRGMARGPTSFCRLVLLGGKQIPGEPGRLLAFRPDNWRGTALAWNRFEQLPPELFAILTRVQRDNQSAPAGFMTDTGAGVPVHEGFTDGRFTECGMDGRALEEGVVMTRDRGVTCGACLRGADHRWQLRAVSLVSCRASERNPRNGRGVTSGTGRQRVRSCQTGQCLTPLSGSSRRGPGVTLLSRL